MTPSSAKSDRSLGEDPVCAVDSGLRSPTRRDVVKWIAIAAVVGVCAVAAVTASAQGTPPTKEPGKLIVGFDLPAPGFWNGRASGTTIRNPSGFEHSLSLAIARQLKIPEVEFLRSPFGGLFSPAPKYDFAFEEVTITAARKKVVASRRPTSTRTRAFSSARASRGPRVFPTSRASRRARRRTPPASPGFGQAAAGEAAARLLGIVVSRLRRGRGRSLRCPDPGRADRRLAEQQEERRLRRRCGQIVTNEFYGAVMEKGSKFKPFLDRAIGILRANGTITRLQKRWLPFTRVPVLK